MRSRARTALGAVLGALLTVPATGLAVPAANAAPADVHVRVEGVASTIFDRVVRTDGRWLQSASDTDLRRCDGTNLGANPAAGPTPTAATVDAMASLGLDFDARWYPGFDDYFITRWGPEAESDADQWWWGILVNRSFTPIGGCQFRVGGGDEVLWVNDAFNGRPFLWLDGPRKVLVDVPFDVTVTATRQSTSGDDPDGEPYEAAQVTAVTVNGRAAAGGIADPGASGADGTAAVTFRQLGWRRLKARALDLGPDGLPDGRDDAIASDSLDVCVVADLAADCAGQPPSRTPVIPPPPPDGPAPPRQPELPRPPVETPPSSDPVRLEQPRIVAGGAGRGEVAVAWRVLAAGAGVARWSIDARPLGVKGGRFAERARGTTATAASLRLPAGRTYELRFTLVDALGRSSTTAIGRVLVPLDDRARQVRRGRSWTAARDAGAWLGTVSRGGSGATLRVRLAAGRPVVVVRPDRRRAARVALVADGRRTVVRIPAGGGSRELRGPARRQAGTVTVRVLSGSVSVDGVGLAP